MPLGSVLQGVLGLGVGKAAELSESVQKAYAQVAQQYEKGSFLCMKIV